MMCRSIKAS